MNSLMMMAESRLSLHDPDEIWRSSRAGVSP
jgi:hypothetical protein